MSNLGGSRAQALTSQLLIQSPPRGHWQSLDELRELDASILQQSDRGQTEWGDRDKTNILVHLTFMNSLSYLIKLSPAPKKTEWGQGLAPSQLLFLPCTWLSPEAQICLLWPLVRWMLLDTSFESYGPQIYNHCKFGARCFTFISQSLYIINVFWNTSVKPGETCSMLTHLFPLGFVKMPHTAPPCRSWEISNYHLEIAACSVVPWDSTLWGW